MNKTTIEIPLDIINKFQSAIEENETVPQWKIEAVKMYYGKLKNEQIKEILQLSRFKFDKIRKQLFPKQY